MFFSAITGYKILTNRSLQTIMGLIYEGTVLKERLSKRKILKNGFVNQ